MMLMKALVASALVLTSSAALSAPQINARLFVGSEPQTEAVRLWSSVCVGNLDLEGPVKVEYRYGDKGEWQAAEIQENSLLILSQRFQNDMAPAKLTLKFKSPQTDDGEELSYELAETVTHIRPRKCDNVENYRFEGTDDDSGVIDLVRVGG